MDTDGTFLYTSSSPLLLTLIADLFPCKSGMTTSGQFADPLGLTGNEPNLANSQHLVALADTRKLLRLWTDVVNPSLEKSTIIHRRTKRSQFSESIGRTTCLLAGGIQTSFELPPSRLRKSSSMM